MSHHHAKLPAWYTLIGFSLFHQLIDQHCHVGRPLTASKKTKVFPPFYSNSNWPERGGNIFFSFLIYNQDRLSHYELMAFVGVHPFVKRKQFVCYSAEAFYSLLTCLCQCQGPRGKSLMCSEWLRFLGPQRTDHGVTKCNPTPSCSTCTKTRNECSHGISQQLFDMLTHHRCFEFCQGTFAQIQTLAV